MDRDGGMDERNEWNILWACHPWDAIAVVNGCCNRTGIQFNDCQRRRRSVEERKKKEADEITILLWLEIIASKKIAFSREEMRGKDVACGGLLYKIFWNAVLLYVCIVLLYLYFSIYVFSTLRAPTKVARFYEKAGKRSCRTVTTPQIRFPSATTGKRMEIGSNLLMIQDRLGAKSPFLFRWETRAKKGGEEKNRYENIKRSNRDIRDKSFRTTSNA